MTKLVNLAGDVLAHILSYSGTSHCTILLWKCGNAALNAKLARDAHTIDLKDGNIASTSRWPRMLVELRGLRSLSIQRVGCIAPVRLLRKDLQLLSPKLEEVSLNFWQGLDAMTAPSLSSPSGSPVRSRKMAPSTHSEGKIPKDPSSKPKRRKRKHRAEEHSSIIELPPHHDTPSQINPHDANETSRIGEEGAENDLHSTPRELPSVSYEEGHKAVRWWNVAKRWPNLRSISIWPPNSGIEVEFHSARGSFSRLPHTVTSIEIKVILAGTPQLDKWMPPNVEKFSFRSIRVGAILQWPLNLKFVNGLAIEGYHRQWEGYSEAKEHRLLIRTLGRTTYGNLIDDSLNGSRSLESEEARNEGHSSAQPLMKLPVDCDANFKWILEFFPFTPGVVAALPATLKTLRLTRYVAIRYNLFEGSNFVRLISHKFSQLTTLFAVALDLSVESIRVLPKTLTSLKGVYIDWDSIDAWKTKNDADYLDLDLWPPLLSTLKFTSVDNTFSWEKKKRSRQLPTSLTELTNINLNRLHLDYLSPTLKKLGMTLHDVPFTAPWPSALVYLSLESYLLHTFPRLPATLEYLFLRPNIYNPSISRSILRDLIGGAEAVNLKVLRIFPNVLFQAIYWGPKVVKHLPPNLEHLAISSTWLKGASLPLLPPKLKHLNALLAKDVTPDHLRSIGCKSVVWFHPADTFDPQQNFWTNRSAEFMAAWPESAILRPIQLQPIRRYSLPYYHSEWCEKQDEVLIRNMEYPDPRTLAQ